MTVLSSVVRVSLQTWGSSSVSSFTVRFTRTRKVLFHYADGLTDFKSYKGHHILLLGDSYFTSIIGPNGSGKSNS